MASLLESLSAWDKALFLLINGVGQNAFFDLLMPFITNGRNFVLPFLLLALYLLIWGGRKGRIALLLAIVLVILADGSATILKHLFQRARPCQVLHQIHGLVGCSGSYSFPSNHAVNAFALATLFTACYRRLLVPLFALAVLVGYSRVYVGVHYPFDVLAGGLWGTALALALVAFMPRFLTLPPLPSPFKGEGTGRGPDEKPLT